MYLLHIMFIFVADTSWTLTATKCYPAMVLMLKHNFVFLLVLEYLTSGNVYISSTSAGMCI